MATRERKPIPLSAPPVGEPFCCVFSTLSNKLQGFRLPGSSIIEMMVIISLIIILALLARANFWPVANRAQRERAQVSIRALGDAALLYYQERRTYPTETAEPSVIRAELSTQVNYDNVSRGLTALQAIRAGTVVPAGQANCIQARIEAFKPNNKNFWVSYCYRPDESTNQSMGDFQPKCLNENAAATGAAWVKCVGGV